MSSPGSNDDKPLNGTSSLQNWFEAYSGYKKRVEGGSFQQHKCHLRSMDVMNDPLSPENDATTQLTMSIATACPSLTNDLLVALTCPISGEFMRDPVTLVQTNETFDRESLCQWLLENPAQCPITGRRFEERLEYIDDLSTRERLVSCLGRNAYRHFDESDFQRQYASKWFDSDTLYNLALHFLNGIDVGQDDEESRYYFELAAERGHAQAQCMLGYIYERGSMGVAIDYSRARHYYELAARQGDADAQYSLGVFYERARGVPQDYRLARQRYVQAAAQGNAHAQCNLGSLCANGQGSPVDYELARQCFQFAAEQGLASAQFNLGMIYEIGLGGVSRCNRLAKLWYRMAAEQGYLEAQVHLDAIRRHESATRQKYATCFVRVVGVIAILAVMHGFASLLVRYGLVKHIFFVFISHGNTAKHIWSFLKGLARPLARVVRRHLGRSHQRPAFPLSPSRL